MKLFNKFVVLTSLTTFLAMSIGGCATTSGANYRPIVDNQGVDLNRYETDLLSCQNYATQTAGAGQSAAGGAAAGAIFGALLAAAAGSNYNRSSHARVGALSGAAGAAADGETSQRNIIRRCLTGRGYKVLQ